MVFTRSMGRQLRSQRKPILPHVSPKKTKKKKKHSTQSRKQSINSHDLNDLFPSHNELLSFENEKSPSMNSSVHSFEHKKTASNHFTDQDVFSDFKDNDIDIFEQQYDNKEPSPNNEKKKSKSPSHQEDNSDSNVEVLQNMSSKVIMPDDFQLKPENGKWKIIGKKSKKNISDREVLNDIVINNKSYYYYSNKDYKKGDIIEFAVPSYNNNNPPLVPLEHQSKTDEELQSFEKIHNTLDRDIKQGEAFRLTSGDGETLTFVMDSDMKKEETYFLMVPPQFKWDSDELHFSYGKITPNDEEPEDNVGEQPQDYGDLDNNDMEPSKLSSSKSSHRRSSESSQENFYEEMPKELTKQPNNPNFDEHLIKIPFRMLIAGGSGSGKTTTLFNIFKKFKGTFKETHIVVANRNEPLYDWLFESNQEENFGKGYHIHEGLENAPEIDEFDADGHQKLIVFDDLVLEKNQKLIEEYFVRGRKKGISTVYLTQRYYGTPILIRQNLTHIILKRYLGNNDLRNILSNYALGIDKQVVFEKLYNNATTRVQDFLLIDLTATPKDRFRKNFRHIYDIHTGKTHETSVDTNNHSRKNSNKSPQNNHSRKNSKKSSDNNQSNNEHNDRISFRVEDEDHDGKGISFPLEQRATYRHRTAKNPNGCSKKYIIYKHNKHDCRPVLREVDLETKTIIHNGRIYPLNSIKGKFRYTDKKPIENVDGTINDDDLDE